MRVTLVVTNSYEMAKIPVTLSKTSLEVLRDFVEDEYVCDIVEIEEEDNHSGH